MTRRTKMKGRLVALVVLASWPPADESGSILPSAIPLRAPVLTWLCATPEEEVLAERRVSFCNGYVRAIVELDTRFQQMASRCAPFPGDIVEEIVRRSRVDTVRDYSVTASDFVYEVTLALCERDGR